MVPSVIVRGILRQAPSDISTCNAAIAPYGKKGSPGDDVLETCLKLGEQKLTAADTPRERSQGGMLVASTKGIRAREMSIFTLSLKIASGMDALRAIKAAQKADPSNEHAFVEYAKALSGPAGSGMARRAVEDNLKIKVDDEVDATRAELDRFSSPAADDAKRALDAMIAKRRR